VTSSLLALSLVASVAAQDPVESVPAPPPPTGPAQAPSQRALELEQHLARADSPGAVLLVLAVDSSGVMGSGDPSLVIESEGRAWTVTLHDDGKSPDQARGDGIHTGSLGIPEQQLAAYALLNVAGDELWSDRAPLSGPETRPRLAFAVEGQHVTALIRTYNDAAGAPIPPGQEPEQPDEVFDEGPDPAMSDPAARPDPAAASVPGAARIPGWLPAAALGLLQLGLLLGGLLAWLGWRRSAKLAPTEPACPPAPWLPSGLGRSSSGAGLWQLPDDDARRAALAGLARAACLRGPVLIVPRHASRPWLAEALVGLPWVLQLDLDRPSRGLLGRALRPLRARGAVTVLVEGLEALEPPAEHESASEVLDELLDLPPRGVELIVLATPAEPSTEPPPLVLHPEDRGLVGPEGLALRAGELGLELHLGAP
jgi:hypothetical protein